MIKSLNLFQASDKYLAAEHSMVDGMLAMMEKYRDRVIENVSLIMSLSSFYI